MFLPPLVWVWFRLIDHLRVEWSLNPQYGYGYAVPFLSAFMIYRALKSAPSQIPIPAFCCRKSWLLIPLALCWFPTRLIQEANPEWRLVSWALAIEAIGITLLLAARARSIDSPLPRLLLFPLLFFLVAVPWPTVIEQPVIQGLARANTAITVEAVNLLGIPALQHGNVIEVPGGTVGIDDACSGIRSFQTSLMLALFFGEVFVLSIARRAICVAAGFALAFSFNIVRSTLLTWVGAHHGTAAIATWHDPAGVGILLACFICLALLAKALGTKRENPPQSTAANPFTLSALNHPPPAAFGLGLCAWFLCAELGTEFWYRAHESRLPAPVTWTIAPPRENPTLRELPLSEKTHQLLRCDGAINAAWQTEAGKRCQAIFLRWRPGRVAVHLARSHTPGVCLPSGGRTLGSESDLKLIPVNGLNLPFRSYTAQDDTGPMHVFYCLWEDRSPIQAFDTMALSYKNRLEPVLAGRRNSGQRSLELALWGCEDSQQAETEFRRQLTSLIRPEPVAGNR